MNIFSFQAFVTNIDSFNTDGFILFVNNICVALFIFLQTKYLQTNNILIVIHSLLYSVLGTIIIPVAVNIIGVLQLRSRQDYNGIGAYI